LLFFLGAAFLVVLAAAFFGALFFAAMMDLRTISHADLWNMTGPNHPVIPN
jgi:hypothetical protein